MNRVIYSNWIKAHTGHYENNLVDKIAKAKSKDDNTFIIPTQI